MFAFGHPWPLVGLYNHTGDTGGGGLTFLIFLGIVSLLDSLWRNFKEQYFRFWCQTRIYLSPYPQRSLVDHSLSMYSLVSSSPTTYILTSSKLVGIWYGLSVGVGRSSPDSSLLYWTKIRISNCIPREPTWCSPLRWKI